MQRHMKFDWFIGDEIDEGMFDFARDDHRTIVAKMLPHSQIEHWSEDGRLIFQPDWESDPELYMTPTEQQE